jgi:hypothetical protein
MAVLGATALTGCDSIPDFIAAGSAALFFNTAAPTSWTKSTAHDNKALRVVSSNGGGSGGSSTFSSVFNGNVGSTTLTTSQLAAHSHFISGNTNLVTNFPGGASNSHGAQTAGNTNGTQIAFSGDTNNTGGNSSHTHSINVQYIDLIICTKN